MKVLLLSGSPRRGGNTERLLQEIRAVLEGAGQHCVLLRLAAMDIAPCRACGGCEGSGRCVIRDGMDEVYEALEEADRLVLGTPVYFYAVSAQLKLMIDRLQAPWAGRYLLGWRPRPGRSAWLVSVAATRGERIFEGVELCCRYAADAAGLAWGGSLLVRGRDRADAVANHPKDLEQARKFARAMLARARDPGRGGSGTARGRDRTSRVSPVQAAGAASPFSVLERKAAAKSSRV